MENNIKLFDNQDQEFLFIVKYYIKTCYMCGYNYHYKQLFPRNINGNIHYICKHCLSEIL